MEGRHCVQSNHAGGSSWPSTLGGICQVPKAPWRMYGAGGSTTMKPGTHPGLALGFLHTLPSMHWLPGRAWGHGTHSVPTNSVIVVGVVVACWAAGSAAVKPRRSSRQGRQPMTPTPPGSNSTSASIAMSYTPAGIPCCPHSSGIWPRKGSSVQVPSPCLYPCPHPCPAACCLPPSSLCAFFQFRSPVGPSSSSS